MQTHTTGIAPIAQFRHMRNKNSNTQGELTLCGKLFPIPQETALKGNYSLLGANSFLNRSSNLKRDIIVENQCLKQ